MITHKNHPRCKSRSSNEIDQNRFVSQGELTPSRVKACLISFHNTAAPIISFGTKIGLAITFRQLPDKLRE
jgi:hypothetical protein